MELPVEIPTRCSIEEYLRLEYAAKEKHEYHDGQIIDMSGGSMSHSLITTNVIRQLGNLLQGKPCQVFDSNLRVRIPRTPLYFYPDSFVICGKPVFDPQDKRQYSVSNPTLVVEVLSPSTEAYDRGDKFAEYLRLESLREYVLVSQDKARVETFFRQPDGTWVFSNFEGISALARIRSLQFDLPMKDVYVGVEFPPLPESSAPAATTDDSLGKRG